MAGNIRNVSFTDPTSMIAPDLAVQQQQVQRQQALADALRQQSMAQIDPGAGQVSWTQGLGKLAQALAAKSAQKRIDAKQVDLSRQYATTMRGMFGGGGPGAPAGADGGGSAPAGDPQLGPQTNALLAGLKAQQPGMSQNQAPSEGKMPQTAAEAPQPGQAAQRGPWSLSGNPQQDMADYMLDPEKYGDAVIAAHAPTDFSRQLQQAGIDPNSPQGRQAMQDNVAKTNYVAPVAARPGGVVLDPRTGKPLFEAAQVPEGYRANYGPDGKATSIEAIPGGPQAVQANAGAKSFGGAAGDLVQVFNPQTGQYDFKPKTAVLQDGGIAAPGAGQQAFTSQLGTDSAKFFTDLQTKAATANQQVAALREVYNLASGPTQFGPGSEGAVKAAGIINGVGQAFGIPTSFNDKNVTSQQEMGKFAAQVAATAANSMGLSGSDARFAVAQAANPSGHMTNSALRTVVPYVMGLAQATADAGRAGAAYAAQHPGPNAQGEFQTLWNNAYDPRLYTWRSLGPQAMASGIKALPPAQAAHMLQQYRQLKAMGALQ